MKFQASGFDFPIHLRDRRGVLSLPDIHSEAEFDLVLSQLEMALDVFAQVGFGGFQVSGISADLGEAGQDFDSTNPAPKVVSGCGGGI